MLNDFKGTYEAVTMSSELVWRCGSNPFIHI